MLIPIRTTSLYNQTPLANWIVMGVTIFVSLAAFFAVGTRDATLGPVVSDMVLQGWTVQGMVGHMLLHGGLIHLAGNMVFLWVFGNAVCAKTGSKLYVPVYVLCGLGGATAQNLFGNGPAIGASGAINGIVGLYLVLQPVNDIEMGYLLGWRWGTFSLAGFWVILYWVAWDVLGLFWQAGQAGGVAYAAHVGGLLTGILLGIVLVLRRMVTMDEYDNPTLPEYLHWVPMGHSGGYGRRAAPGAARRPPPVVPPRQAQIRRPVPLPIPLYSSPPRSPQLQPRAAEVSPPRSISFDCPHCSRGLELEGVAAGSEIHCPACNGSIRIELD